MQRWLVMVLLILTFPNQVLALVNINTASIEELDTIPGVGTSTAQKIINARPFSSIEDIKRVSGIGDATYEKLKSYITVSEATDIVVSDNSTNDTSNTVSGSSVVEGKKVVTPKVTEFTISAPGYVFVSQPVEFKAIPTVDSNARFTHIWNFGDGISERQGQPIHTYHHPGIYVVVVESYDRDDILISRTQIEVLPPSLSVKDFNNQITINNHGDREVDLFGMRLVRTGGEFIFPQYSILLPQSSITVSLGGNGEVSLLDQSHRPVAFSRIEVTEPKTSLVTKSVAPKVSGVSDVKEGVDEIVDGGSMIEASIATATETASLSNTKDHSNMYLGLIGVIFLALIVVYGTIKP